MKGIAFVFMLSLMLGSSAQSGFFPGIEVRTGSSGVSLRSDPKATLPDGSELKLKQGFSFGLSLTGDWRLDSLFGISFSAGAQQQRAVFKDYPDDPLPRYEFNFLELCIKPFGTIGDTRNRMFVNGGPRVAWLFSGWRVYDTGADIITDDLNRWDIGFTAEVGFEFRRKANDLFRLGFSVNGGASEVFSGMLRENGMRGRHFSTLLHLQYVLGK